MIQQRRPGIIHIVLHLLLPALAARLFFARRLNLRWLQAWGIMMLTMLVDADHLLADPVYDPLRCSMGFHPLHTFFPVVGYILLLVPKQTRLVGAGLVIHMLLDTADCITMPGGLSALRNFLPIDL